MRQGRTLLACALGAALLLAPAAGAAPDRHLRVLKSNPRYFTDGTGKAVYLTGSHVWWNLTGPDWLSDCGTGGATFTNDGYLDRLEHHGHNFIRLWRIEHTRWERCYETHGGFGVTTTALQPWLRTGPGNALDGLPRFDLEQLDQSYFDRLRERVAAAQQRGIYVAVMLFEGWWLHSVGQPWAWTGHPFHAGNNVNGIDGDLDGDGFGTEIVTLADPDVLAIQEAYVRKVVETVNDLDNVLYEIANEPGVWSTQWQYHMIRLVRELQSERGERRPIGMTYPHPGGSNKLLYRSPADWISPWAHRYMSDPPPGDGRKVIVSDTDHHCGICGNATFPWRSFMRGLNPIYMDILDLEAHDPKRVRIRDALGQTRRWSKRIDLAASRPRGHLSSTRYALSAGRRQFLVYAPKGGRFRVDLRKAKGRYRVVWFRPEVDRSIRGKPVRGGAWRRVRPPFRGPAVLFLRRL
jgi:hypothetical protein